MASASRVAGSGLTLVRPELRDTIDAETSERRVHRRLTLSDLEWLNTVRLKYGPIVSLIDLSPGGAQIETSHRLNPGGIVVVQISGCEGEVTVPSTVLRCQVSRVAPYAMYRTALSFKRTLDAPGSPGDRGSDSFADLVGEHARMTGAIRRFSQAEGVSGLSLIGDDLLTTMLTLIQSPAGRRAGDGFRRHLTQVFRELTRGIESGTHADVMLARLAERLRRSVPTRIIRIAEGATSIGPHGPDTIYFDATREGSVLARLVVEFPRDCRLEEWHLPFLRIAAQLIALVGDLSRLQIAASRSMVPADPAPSAAPDPTAPPFPSLEPTSASARVIEGPVPQSANWIKVVARYADGRMLKGYCRGFVPSRGYLSVSPTPDAAPPGVTTVPLRHLKAVFVVQDLEGTPAGVEPTPTARGRNVVVCFMDGEVLNGTTLNYAVDGPGFFVSPHEQRGNNLRVFVVNEAVRHVQFP